MTGRAEVIDPVGKDTNDTFVCLKPKKEWTTVKDLDGLSVAFKDALEREVPSTFFSISQPIEDRTHPAPRTKGGAQPHPRSRPPRAARCRE